MWGERGERWMDVHAEALVAAVTTLAVALVAWWWLDGTRERRGTQGPAGNRLANAEAEPPASPASSSAISAGGRAKPPQAKGKELEIVLAPMVDGSELAFRMLCRRYGATRAYTPMLRAEEILDTFANATSCCPCIHPSDRPLVVQLCGNEPSALASATTALLQHLRPDGIDLNLGCPQPIAEKEGMGAFLAERCPDMAVDCVRAIKASAEKSKVPGGACIACTHECNACSACVRALRDVCLPSRFLDAPTCIHTS